MDREEGLLHALWTCQAKSNVRSSIFSNLLTAPSTQPVTTHLLWSKFVRMRTDNIIVMTLGNYANWIITLEFLKARNKKRINSEAVTSFAEGEM